MRLAYGVGMCATTDPDDEGPIINEFIVDPDASSILRQAMRRSQKDSAEPNTEDALDAQVEDAKEER
jgi:hypothetical protein